MASVAESGRAGRAYLSRASSDQSRPAAGSRAARRGPVPPLRITQSWFHAKIGRGERGEQVHPGAWSCARSTRRGPRSRPSCSNSRQRPVPASSPEASPSSRSGRSTLRGAHRRTRGRRAASTASVAAVLADAGLVALVELSRLEHAPPPLRPALGVEDRVPDALALGLEQPGGEEAGTRPSHRRLVAGRASRRCRSWALGRSTTCEKRITVTGVLVVDRRGRRSGAGS